VLFSHLTGYDLYRPEVTEDLQKYFDRFCKGIKNGWEISCPPVRLSLLGFDDSSPAKTVLERPDAEYPLARQQLHKFYLDVSDKSLNEEPREIESTDTYEAHNLKASLVCILSIALVLLFTRLILYTQDFVLKFDRATELAGYSKAKLYLSCAEHDDMDVVVQIRKVDIEGRPLQHLNYPCPVPVEEVPDFNTAKTLGPQGFLRASHAVSLDPDSSSDVQPFYTHRIRSPVKPGTIIPLEIGIWPIGMVFAAGEGIMLRVSGHDMCLPETDMCRLTEAEDENVGYHTIYTSGRYDSHLIVPVIPLLE
jgi:predicted acyl esterase